MARARQKLLFGCLSCAALVAGVAVFMGRRGSDTQPLAGSRQMGGKAVSRGAPAHSTPGPERSLGARASIEIARWSGHPETPVMPVGLAQLEAAVAGGLAWLAEHQNEAGHWDAEGFMHHTGPEPSACECRGIGDVRQNVRLTGLCLLAFVSDGHTHREGEYRFPAIQAIKWLREQQDYESGHFKGTTIHGHSIVTLALMETYISTRSPTLKSTLVKGLRYLEQPPSYFRGWQFFPFLLSDHPGTASPWLTLLVPLSLSLWGQSPAWLEAGSLRWVDSVFESREQDDGGVATAGALLAHLASQCLRGGTPAPEDDAAESLLGRLPRWDPSDPAVDLERWFLATCALYQLGRPHWPLWRIAMAQAALEGQRIDGHFAGSWDPIGRDRFSGGRVHATAMMVLCLTATIGSHQVLDDW